jgi:hypothetical protein
MDASERERRLRAEIERLEGQLATVERERRRMPWLLVSAVLAIPAAVVWGLFAAALVLLGAVTLFGTGYYLVAVRHSEYQGELDDARRDLKHTRAHPRQAS